MHRRKGRQDTIELNQAESRRFVEALHAKPKAPNSRVKRALKLYRASVTER